MTRAHSSTILVWLIACHLAVGVVFGLAVDFGPNPTQGQVWFIALIFAEACLVGFACVMANIHWASRIGTALGGLFWLRLLFSMWGNQHPQGDELLALITIPPLVVGLLCLVARRMGWRVRPTVDFERAESLRFSLRAMLLLTAAVSVGLGAGLRLFPKLPGGVQAMLVVAGSQAAVGLLATRVALARSWLVVSLAFTFGAACLAGYLSNYWGPGSDGYLYVWIEVYVAQATIVVLTLWVVRLSGYRGGLIRMEPAAGTTQPGAQSLPSEDVLQSAPVESLSDDE